MTTLTKLDTGTPVSSVAAAVERVGGIEEEWFIEGEASAFRLVGGRTEHPTDGRWAAERSGALPFRTRLLVVRPADPVRFNGTVVVNWNNVSGGESFEPPKSAARYVDDGFVLVGVSAQRVGVEGSGAPPGTGFQMAALKMDDPERYGSLAHPGDDYSYDIFTQAALVLGPSRSGDTDPLPGFDIRHLIATGGSQSAARLMCYINAVQPLDAAYDAFLLTVFPNAPCAVNAEAASPSLPRMGGPNPFALLDWNAYVIRDDLASPCIVLNSEAEAVDCYPNTQPESDNVRVWEVPGAGHASRAHLRGVRRQPHHREHPALRGVLRPHQAGGHLGAP